MLKGGRLFFAYLGGVALFPICYGGGRLFFSYVMGVACDPFYIFLKGYEGGRLFFAYVMGGGPFFHMLWGWAALSFICYGGGLWP